MKITKQTHCLGCNIESTLVLCDDCVKKYLTSQQESESVVVEVTGLDEHGNYRAEPIKGYLDPVRGTYRLTRIEDEE